MLIDKWGPLMSKLKLLIFSFLILSSTIVIFQNCGERVDLNQYSSPSVTPQAVAPEITFMTGNGTLTLTEGQPLALVVTATGSNLQYAWYKNNLALAGMTTTELNKPAVALADAGTYAVKVSNSVGDDLAEVVLTVNPLLQPVISCSSAELTNLHASAGSKTLSGTTYGNCVPSACASGYTLSGSTCYANTRTCTNLDSLNASAGTQTFNGSSYGACNVTACKAGTTTIAASRVGQYDPIASVTLNTYQLRADHSRCDTLTAKPYNINASANFTIPGSVRISYYTATNSTSCGTGDYRVSQPATMLISGGCSAAWVLTYYKYE